MPDTPADEIRAAATRLRSIRFTGAMTLAPAVAMLIRTRAPLAGWLDQEAHAYDSAVRAAGEVFRDDPDGHAEFLTTGPGAPSAHALAIARLVNQEQQ